MTFHPESQSPRDREGIALVVVLGFLSLLVILAVGFAVAMRTERLAARNFADVVRARQLMHAAVARAIVEIDNNLSVPSPVIYPPWGALPSLGGTGEPPPSLMHGQATNFIPVAMMADATNEARNATWISIIDRKGANIGRYAYVVVNCSGLLDASVVGGVARAAGTSATEIVIANMPELNQYKFSVVPPGTFFTTRSNKWKRFESIPDLWAATADPGSGGPCWNSYPSDFFVFSRFPADTNLNIGGTAADLEAQRDPITAALNDAGVPNAGIVFTNLLDYVDLDSIPRDVESFVTEPIPMVNEVVVESHLEVTGAGVFRNRHIATIKVELWSPFLPGFVGSYRLGAVPGVSFDTITGNPPLPMFSSINPTNVSPTPGASRLDINVPGPGFYQGSYTYEAEVITTGIPMPVLVMNTVITNLEVFSGTSLVDRARPAKPIQTRAQGPSGKDEKAVPCVDPRLNFDPLQWGDVEAPSLLATNRIAIGKGEGISEMYVRNGPLQSVAELGFLSVGAPWRTISLYNAPGSSENPTLHPVLDYFRIGSPPTNAARGLINANSGYSNVLAAAFLDAPIQYVPAVTSSAPSRVGRAEAQAFAANILDQNANILTTLSPIGSNLFGNTEWRPGGSEGLTDAQRESIIRNTYELFSLRQNLFTVILAAQALDPSGGVAAEQRAVAVVWRDPVANANGHHPAFVRFFQWLNE
jgi:hypothetical protein